MRYPIQLLALILLIASAKPLMADALVVNRAMQESTIMEAYVTEAELRVELEVGFSDLPAFADLLPDELYEKMGNPPEDQGQRMRRFFENGLRFSAAGDDLPGRLRWIEVQDRVRRDPVSGEALPLPEGEEAEKVVQFILEYPLEGKPASLSLASLPTLPLPANVAPCCIVKCEKETERSGK